MKRQLKRRLRKVTRQLGTVRELDVLTCLNSELAEDGRYPGRALKKLGATAAQARAKARRRLAAKLPKAKLERLARKLKGVADDLDSGVATQGRRRKAPDRRRGAAWALEARLVRRAGGVRAAIEGAGAAYVPEHLHDVRIAVKKLRYAAELAADATGKRISGDVTTLACRSGRTRATSRSGNTPPSPRNAQAVLSPPDLTTWRDLTTLAHLVEADCRQLHARYLRDRVTLIRVAERMNRHRRQA